MAPARRRAPAAHGSAGRRRAIQRPSAARATPPAGCAISKRAKSGASSVTQRSSPYQASAIASRCQRAPRRSRSRGAAHRPSSAPSPISRAAICAASGSAAPMRRSMKPTSCSHCPTVVAARPKATPSTSARTRTPIAPLRANRTGADSIRGRTGDQGLISAGPRKGAQAEGPMGTIVVTGSASGIGAATAERLRKDGHRVIGVDLRSGEVLADLGTEPGRRAALAAIAKASGGELEGVVSAAGAGPYDDAATVTRVNYFGAVAMLDGLLELLARGRAPAAVAISSIGAVFDALVDPGYVAACLDGDEARALREIE